MITSLTRCRHHQATGAGLCSRLSRVAATEVETLSDNLGRLQDDDASFDRPARPFILERRRMTAVAGDLVAAILHVSDMSPTQTT